jgi:hypothetical protein
MDEKATWAIKDERVHEIGKMEEKGHTRGACNSM